MGDTDTRLLSRRRFLGRAGAATLAVGAAPAVIIPGRAQGKTLRIMQWKHFVPSFDRWFNAYVKEWGERNDTEVTVDYIGLGDATRRATEEAKAGRGHDLVLLIAQSAAFEDSVIDHREIFEEAAQRYGKPLDAAYKSAFNPRTGKHHSFPTNVSPSAITYREDWWDATGTVPATWDDVRRGGRRIKLLRDRPVGFSLAADHNGQHTLRTLLYSFGGAEQDTDGQPALESRETLEALKFVKALFEEAMTPDVLRWNPVSNNRSMLSGESSLTVDTLSIVRAAEAKSMPAGDNLRLAALPRGPAAQLGPAFGIYNYVIWNFAENVEGAKQFLVDLIGDSRAGFLASGFQNMPSYPDAVADFGRLVAQDDSAAVPDQYALLTQSGRWMTNLGFPGFAHAAIDEVYNRGVIPAMFARTATGDLSAEDALGGADREVRRIFADWKARGKV